MILWGMARGKFFEYLFYNWLTEIYPATYKKVGCDTTIGNQQIDVYAETENEIYLFECKINLHSGSDRRSGIKAVIKQIKEKVKVIESKMIMVG